MRRCATQNKAIGEKGRELHKRKKIPLQWSTSEERMDRTKNNGGGGGVRSKLAAQRDPVPQSSSKERLTAVSQTEILRDRMRVCAVGVEKEIW